MFNKFQILCSLLSGCESLFCLRNCTRIKTGAAASGRRSVIHLGEERLDHVVVFVLVLVHFSRCNVEGSLQAGRVGQLREELRWRSPPRGCWLGHEPIQENPHCPSPPDAQLPPPRPPAISPLHPRLLLLLLLCSLTWALSSLALTSAPASMSSSSTSASSHARP